MDATSDVSQVEAQTTRSARAVRSDDDDDNIDGEEEGLIVSASGSHTPRPRPRDLERLATGGASTKRDS